MSLPEYRETTIPMDQVPADAIASLAECAASSTVRNVETIAEADYGRFRYYGFRTDLCEYYVRERIA